MTFDLIRRVAIITSWIIRCCPLSVARDACDGLAVLVRRVYAETVFKVLGTEVHRLKRCDQDVSVVFQRAIVTADLLQEQPGLWCCLAAL